MIYLDNAATTFHKPPEVEKAVVEAMHTVGNAGRGAHAATLGASRLIYDTREKLAQLFGISDPLRIAFTSNATEALNIAIQGLFFPRDHVISTVCEHNSVLRPLYLMEKEGVGVSLLSADDKGRLDYDKLEELYRPNTKAVVITHASNLTGNVTDLEKVGEFTRWHGIQLIVDASQTAGVLPIDVEKSGIDVLCFTGHKGLLGPQGTGGIYVREGICIRALKVGGSGVHSYEKEHPSVMPTALEAGTLNSHGIAGLNAAVSYLLSVGVKQVGQQERALADRFVQGVQQMENVRLYGDYNMKERVGIVSLNIGDIDSATVSDWLWEDYEIAVRSGAHCAPLMHEALGTQKQGAVRFSFSYYNTEKEVDAAVEAVRTLAREAAE
ncbi:aminotransferase class V-fold PLP-dependent enzyme [Blautia schinkii]|nr:aminotransferase class V-fold PLP-dependent enzyme [Blautia schinkii]